MKNYKFTIEEIDNSGYIFVLYPNNSNTQKKGESKIYSNYKDCTLGLYNFKKFVKENKLDNFNSNFMKIDGNIVQYINDNEIIFITPSYGQISNKIKSIYKHIDSPFKEDL